MLLVRMIAPSYSLTSLQTHIIRTEKKAQVIRSPVFNSLNSRSHGQNLSFTSESLALYPVAVQNLDLLKIALVIPSLFSGTEQTGYTLHNDLGVKIFFLE